MNQLPTLSSAAVPRDAVFRAAKTGRVVEIEPTLAGFHLVDGVYDLHVGASSACPLGVEVSAYSISVSSGRYADDLTIQRARQIEGPPLWKVIYRGNVLNRDGEWEYEPMPSSRTEEFLARCRFSSAEDAIAIALAAKEKL